MKVIKRDGHTVTYDRSKIITAIKKANAEVEPGEKVTDEKIEEIVQGIRFNIVRSYCRGLNARTADVGGWRISTISSSRS